MQYRGYQERIQTIIGGADVDPRHIEAYMRLKYGVLDHLGPAEFREEVHVGIACVLVGGREEAEWLAQSYGL